MASANMVCARAPSSWPDRDISLLRSPQVLDYPKGVFAARPGPRARPVDHSPALAQRPLGGRAPIDPVAHSPRLEKLAIVFLPVRLVAEDFPLLSVQQVGQLRNVGNAGRGRSHRMHDTALVRADRAASSQSTSCSPCGFASSRDRGFALAFLVELGAAMIVASTGRRPIA